MDALTHPVVVALLMAAALIFMQVVAHVEIAKRTPEQAKGWATVAVTVLMTVVPAVVIVPTIQNLWAERRDKLNDERAQKREAEREQRAARDTQQREAERLRQARRDDHLKRLRPLLLADSKKLLQLSNQMAVEGTAIGGFLLKDKEQELDRDYWYPDLLYRDFAAHFPDFGKVRESVREEVFLQQKAVFDLQSRALESFKTEPEDEAVSIAITLVRECLGTGKGMNLEITPAGGYRYTDSGAPEQRQSPPPPNLIRRVQAYKAFKPSNEFKASCDAAAKGYKRLATALQKLSVSAAVAAESPALFGECSYVPPP